MGEGSKYNYAPAYVVQIYQGQPTQLRYTLANAILVAEADTALRRKTASALAPAAY